MSKAWNVAMLAISWHCTAVQIIPSTHRTPLMNSALVWSIYITHELTVTGVFLDRQIGNMHVTMRFQLQYHTSTS